MLFVLFLVLNVALYVRPEELVGEIFGGQLYLVSMCCILPLLLGRFVARLGWLRQDPVSCCVLAFYFSTIMSSILTVGLPTAFVAARGFGKEIVAYFVAFEVLSGPRNLRRYLVVLPLLLASIAGIGMLRYFDIVDNPAITLCVEGEFDEQQNIVGHYTRMASSGVFSDPNDLCLAIAVALALCAYHLIERRSVMGFALAVPLVPFLIAALILTKSRGGMIAVAAILLSLFVSRFGARWGGWLALTGLVGLFALSGGRQTSFDTSQGTAQGRIQIWADGLDAWKGSPIVGVGYNQYVEKANYVAHNSYVHAFVETGLGGGAAFLGIFACLLAGLVRTPPIDDDEVSDDEETANRARPYILAALVGYCVGMHSISRNYVIPTYMLAALGNGCLWISHPPSERTWFVMDGAMVRRLLLLGGAVLIALGVFVKVFVQYG